MKRCLGLLFFLILLHADVSSQVQYSSVIYLDDDWNPVRTREEAMYYRTAEKMAEGFLVKDYYKENDQLQMEAICSELEPVPVLNGMVRFYFKNGQMEKSGRYEKGKPVALHNHYYEHGQVKGDFFYTEKNTRIYQYWDEKGVSMLQNGSGVIKEKDESSGEVAYVVVEDSTVSSGFVINDKSDTIYLQATEPVKYRGGIETFYRQLEANLVYPRPARRYGIEGKVFLQLQVNELGRMENAIVLKGIGGGCDEEAVRVCKLLQQWIPATHKGKLVKMRMVLPISFKLN